MCYSQLQANWQYCGFYLYFDLVEIIMGIGGDREVGPTVGPFPINTVDLDLNDSEKREKNKNKHS